MTLTIAGLQHDGVSGDVDANLAIIAEAAREAASRGARLLVTPEMFVTGYNIGERLAPLATADLVDRVAAIAAEAGIGIVAGLPEPLPDGGIANALVLVDADGAALLRYRKTHLFGDLDRSLFEAGDALPGVVEIDGVRVSLLICYDVEFPETVRAASLAAADVVIVPTAQMEPYAHIAERLIPVRAWENQVHLVYVNRVGSEGDLTYVGRSSMVSPAGEILDSLDSTSTGLMIATIDPEVTRRARQENPYLADRRPELY
ncbi:putative amidohydrolase [Labedella gwakjiensis]|uniref:Carbon-nitrogen hydrolase family protein n=1 Tax=Labedella gwakjiensis TaxID=390269 RepID=A0A2P8GUN0_9MICO|nr:carbon-nitrogen hydrolase family protein [Labedella gwakjiensis]PSL37670.1 putative amidohydrolase [Labedella gwakjiensis]RUQ87735.1 carbon-nitrogen hydrolase family protein [Labedella gwakjiensis]